VTPKGTARPPLSYPCEYCVRIARTRERTDRRAGASRRPDRPGSATGSRQNQAASAFPASPARRADARSSGGSGGQRAFIQPQHEITADGLGQCRTGHVVAAMFISMDRKPRGRQRPHIRQATPGLGPGHMAAVIGIIKDPPDHAGALKHGINLDPRCGGCFECDIAPPQRVKGAAPGIAASTVMVPASDAMTLNLA